MNENERLDIIEGTDAEGNKLMLSVEKYFFYNGEEYVLLRSLEEAPGQTGSLYVMKVDVFTDEDGEEVEDFLPVEEELMESLIEAVNIRYTEDETLEEERQEDA